MLVSVAGAQVPELAPVAAGNPGEGGFVSWIDTSKLVVPEEVGKTMQPLPASFDWRTLGTTPAKDQGLCGVCWIFAGMGDLESKVKIDGLGEWDYSEQEILDCNVMGKTCTSAGNAWAYFNQVSQSCTVLEGDYPYTGVKGSCSPVAAKHERALQMRTIADDSPGAARDWIKHTIMNEGPVYCSIYSGAAQFQNYYGAEYGMFYPPATTDHAVILVGWDDTMGYYDEYPPNFAEIPAGYGCWIIKNSWGTSWGQNGFGYVGYGAGNVATQNSYISEYADCFTDTGEVLRYDESFLGYFLGVSGNYTNYGAVRFTSTSSEDITGVGIWVPVTGAQYWIYIYDDANPGSNSWTGLLDQRSGTLTEGGYHMIEIDPAVPIPADNDFWVRVRVTDPSNSWPYLLAGDSGTPTETGTCYFSLNGTSWTDMGTMPSGHYDLGLHARLGGVVQPTPTPPATGIGVWEEYR